MHRRAFTLIELLVVISIIALLSSVVLASLNSAREKGRIAAAQQFATQIYHALGDQQGGFWRFEEGPGSPVALDSTGNGNTGTINAATYTTDTPSGKGYALSFDGSTAYVDIPIVGKSELQAITDPGTPGFTFACWFKAASLPTSAGDGYMVFRIGYHVGIRMNRTDGQFYSILWFFDNSNSTVSGSYNLNDGKWHHLALSVNESKKTQTMFVDGKETSSTVYTKALKAYSNSGNYRIGGDTNYFVHGTIDDAMIFAAPIK